MGGALSLEYGYRQGYLTKWPFYAILGGVDGFSLNKDEKCLKEAEMNISQIIYVDAAGLLVSILLAGMTYCNRMQTIQRLSSKKTCVVPSDVQSGLRFWSNDMLYVITLIIFCFSVMFLCRGIRSALDSKEWICYAGQIVITLPSIFASQYLGKWLGKNDFHGWLRQQA